MINVTDTQKVALENAADTDDGQITPPPNVRGGAVTKMFNSMVGKGVAEEIDGAYFMTNQGREAIGLPAKIETIAYSVPETTTKPRQRTKQALIIEMLKRPEGATISQIMANTGWQKHTVRGTFAGALKKRMGLNITSTKTADAERVYRVS